MKRCLLTAAWSARSVQTSKASQTVHSKLAQPVVPARPPRCRHDALTFHSILFRRGRRSSWYSPSPPQPQPPREGRSWCCEPRPPRRPNRGWYQSTSARYAVDVRAVCAGVTVTPRSVRADNILCCCGSASLHRARAPGLFSPNEGTMTFRRLELHRTCRIPRNCFDDFDTKLSSFSLANLQRRASHRIFRLNRNYTEK